MGNGLLVYLETPNCRHMATLAVDSLFLSTLNEHSGNANAGDILCMRCGNIWNAYRENSPSRTRALAISFFLVSSDILTQNELSRDPADLTRSTNKGKKLDHVRTN